MDSTHKPQTEIKNTPLDAEQSNSEQKNMQSEKKAQIVVPTWLKRLGVAGFLFFFIKGLVWLAVFYFGANWIKKFWD